MAKSCTGSDLARQLAAALSGAFPEIRVEIGKNERWNRQCLTFEWDGFRSLLPEERFHRLTGAIPAAMRGTLEGGYVWVELAPGESIDEFLKLPRSEDVEPREGGIYNDLIEHGFFQQLGQALGPSPDKRCRRDFSETESILASSNVTDQRRVVDVKLVGIRHGGYCDCQLLLTVWPVLAKLYADAA